MAVAVGIGVGLSLGFGSAADEVRLSAGTHPGPLVVDSAQAVVGESGAVVEGGVVITADGVTLRGLRISGGENGIEVDGAEGVVIEDVEIFGSRMDGIHVRRGQVEIRNCHIHSLTSPYAQGIDISFSFDLPASVVHGCSIAGGQEGIVSHFAQVEVTGNHVSHTGLRGITVTEMSRGTVDDNQVQAATGVGIFCGDYSECEILDNQVLGTRPDDTSGDGFRQGFPIVAHFGAKAYVAGNLLQSNAAGVAAQAGGQLTGPDAAD